MDGYQHWCINCEKEYFKEYHVNNREKKINIANKWRKNNKEQYNKKYRIYKQIHTDLFIEYKSSIGCKLCREIRGECLLFHHINPNEKEVEMTIDAFSFHKESFLKELEKCICLCQNCHHSLHFWYKRLFRGDND